MNILDYFVIKSFLKNGGDISLCAGTQYTGTMLYVSESSLKLNTFFSFPGRMIYRAGLVKGDVNC